MASRGAPHSITTIKAYQRGNIMSTVKSRMFTGNRMYLVNVSGQESVVKASWSGEAVLKVMHLQPYEIDKRVTIDSDGWYVVDTVKGTVYAKPLEDVEGLIERHQKTAPKPYRVSAQAYYGELCVYADYYRTRAKTQNGLHRTMMQVENNFKHILDVMGYDWTRLTFKVEYK